ncbi:hypothetical protein HDU78_004707 [Chytriomyces hyalinus]|nr:hypothetical protein HDU78_004707 [Chytriomyces hyalinus]
MTNDDLKAQWTEIQDRLKTNLITLNHNLSFTIGPDGLLKDLHHVVGVDVSFYPSTEPERTDDSSSEVAVICLAVLSFPQLQLVHEIIKEVHLPIPYIPGFLAMREAPAVSSVLADLALSAPHLYPPQILFVDGNGVFHPRGFGVASQIGVETGIPTIGVAKNLLEVHSDGITASHVKHISDNLVAGGWEKVVGLESQRVYGACVRATKAAKNPVYVSVGHAVDLDTAVALTLACSLHRVPEPVRFADHLGREYIRKKRTTQLN